MLDLIINMLSCLPYSRFNEAIMHNHTIAVIGSGNMGTSLISGLLAGGYPKSQIWVSDPNEDKLKLIEHQFGVNIAQDNSKAISHADIIIFAIKPQIFASVLQPLAKSLQLTKPLIISIAAGITVASIQKWLGGNMAIVRTMPNTPALIGCGASALYANQFVSEEQRHNTETILRAVGLIAWLEDEKLLDAVTAISGSGPAYFFLMIEAIQEIAESFGLSKDIARVLTLQTALGSARMAMESTDSVIELRQRVTSPGGTTAAALEVLMQQNFKQIFMQALTAAKKRSEELANKLATE
jgi:pyrroline-5-carboxylate reductase